MEILVALFMAILISYIFYLGRRFFFSSKKPQGFKVSEDEAYKMVLLIRTDIGMSKGKAAAQCAHAAIAAYTAALSRQPRVLHDWQADGQAKVTLKVDSEADLVELVKKARASGIISESIRDAGRTQLAAGTRTVAAIGPAPAKLIDLITGHLKLY